MGAMMGLLSHAATSVQSLTSAGAQGKTATAGIGASPTVAPVDDTGSTSSASSSSATISSNDFLSLLVTEMKNQDPTANTDPNEYINQLVQVNSLEQLISINQNLTTALGSPSSASGTPPGVVPSGAASASNSLTGAGSAADHAKAAVTGHGVTAISTAAGSGGSSTAAAISRFTQSVGGGRAPGNLAVPAAQPASKTLAHALDGHPHARASHGHLPGTR